MKKNDLDFTGKTAIVTGGRRGIGRAIALAYAEHGAEVAVIAKNHDGSGILADLEKTGTPGHYFSCDIGDESSRRGLIAEVVKQLGGRLDILVNNAGMQFVETIENCTEDNWKKSEALMLDAPYDFSRQAIPFMKAQLNGKIIMISSICAIREGGANFGYGVMKAGVAAMARCMANSLAQYNIQVNAIAPGIIRTDLTERQGCFEDHRYKSVIQKYPAGRLGEPEEIAGVALFLGSNLSSFMDGQLLIVDGGFSGN